MPQDGIRPAFMAGAFSVVLDGNADDDVPITPSSLVL
jgi:hypothetical protein